MRHLLHALPAVCFLASLASARQQDELALVRDAYAAGLQALSDRCVEADLLNDAERLLLEAASWTSAEEGLAARNASLREHRIAKIHPSERGAYRAFLNSKDFLRKLEKLQRKERDLKQEAVRAFLELARLKLGDGEEEPAVQALELVSALDPENAKLRQVAGKERMERIRAGSARDRSLSRMTLGETLEGPQVTLVDLEGKVVLWRSASL